RVFGINITRSQHPKSLLIFTPLLSGGMFVIGFAYFRPELVDRFFANEHLESSLRLAVFLIISYVSGIILSATVVLPFTSITYVASYFGTVVMISLARYGLNVPIQPSSRPAGRRAATVVLGDTM